MLRGGQERKAAGAAPTRANYRLIIDRIPCLLFTCAPNGEVEYTSRPVLEYFGKTFEDLQAWKSGNAVHPDDLERIAMEWGHAVTTGQPWTSEHRLRRADGVYRWFQQRSVPHFDAQGRVTRYYGTLTDIDDLRRAETELRELQTRLSRASHLAAVSELSAAIAHEVNQPLAAVIANAEACQLWLSSDVPNIERALLSLDRIIRDARAGAEIVRRMRSLFRQASPAKEPLDLNEVIHEVIRLLADDLRSKGISFTKNLAALPPVAADRVQIQQVLVNLVRNGIEAMDGVTKQPKLLSISSRTADAEVIIEVSDEGVGVHDAESVFETFYTTKPGGMGMGLAVSRSIVQAHGGRLWVTNNVPCGATFGVALGKV